MKIRIIITDDRGESFQGEVTMTPVGEASARHVPQPNDATQASPSALDFGLPVRAFVKRYARGLSGSQRFALLVARLVEGKIGPPVPLKDVEKQWNRMTAFMGGRFNAAYSSRAKDSGWVESAKPGMYSLRANWDECRQER